MAKKFKCKRISLKPTKKVEQSIIRALHNYEPLEIIIKKHKVSTSYVKRLASLIGQNPVNMGNTWTRIRRELIRVRKKKELEFQKVAAKHPIYQNVQQVENTDESVRKHRTVICKPAPRTRNCEERGRKSNSIYTTISAGACRPR